MAHEIEIIGDVANFAYIGERPWHGLGQELQPGATPEEMKQAAGLDWKVEMKPLYTQAADGSFVEVPSHKVAVRSTDGEQFTVGGRHWIPTQNDDFFQFAAEFASETNSFVETAGSLRNGKTPFCLININKDFVVGKREDVVKNYLLLSWSHVVGKANRAKAVSTRVVCANTEAMAMREKGLMYNQSHAYAFDFGKVRAMYDLAVEASEQQAQDYNKLNTVLMNRFDVVKFLQPLLQPVTPQELEAENKSLNTFIQELTSGVGVNVPMDEVLDSMQTAPGSTPGDLQSGWSVFNGLTYWSNHRAGRVKDARLASAWFGARGETISTAKRQLLEMAA